MMDSLVVHVADLYTYPILCVFLGAQLIFTIQIPVLINLDASYIYVGVFCLKV